jgi:hypothetical protein
MLRLFHAHAARALLLTVPLASACTMAGSYSYQSDQPLGHHVLVDGVSVSSHNSTLLELLMARSPFIRFLGNPNTQPVVVVDGIKLIGSASRLGEVRATDVRSVKFVRPIDATFLYGGDASNGAIVIETMRGR